MAYQPVDIGSAPNDGTGDPIRDAFDKCNDNFTELYTGLTGLLDFKGSTDCSANPNYPAASKGDYYLVSVAGNIGGASGISVQAGDSYFALADNAGGTQASVGTSWTVVQGNLIVDNDTTLAGDSTTAVPTQHAVKTYADGMMPKSGGTFTGDIVVPDEAYDATNWNGNLEAPTKNAVRDKIESLSGGSFTAASTTEVLTGTDNSKGVTPDALAALWEQGSDVASAGTISLGEGGFFHVTGTTTITDIDFATDKAGRTAWVEFTGALTLTHNASTLILPTGANITTAAGDTACFVSEGSDVVRCVAYQKASGAALTGSSASFRGALVYKSADQTTANFSTGAPVSWNSEDYDTDSIHEISSTVTITIATPGVVTWTGHTFTAGSPIVLTTSGALPTGLTAGTIYYVVSPAANTFQLAATPGGSAINTTGSQSGTHTGTNYSRLTVPSGVTKVRLRGQISLSLVAAGSDTYIHFRKNGALMTAPGNPMQAVTDPNTSTIRMNIGSPPLTVSSGDYFEMELSCADTSVTIDAQFSWQSMEIIG